MAGSTVGPAGPTEGPVGPTGPTKGPARAVRLPSLPGGGTGWAVGAGVVGLATVTVVTASTPVDVVSAPPRGSASSVLLETPPTPTTLTNSPPPSVFPDINSLPSLPPVLLTAIELIVGALVIWALYYLLRFAWRQIPRVRTRTVPRPSLTSLPPLPDELVESADHRAELLREGSPRNAIVACWVDLEDSASAAGLPREPSETSAEYTIRVLHTWDIAPDALGGLAELYREARYSRHAVTEEHRSQAIARLEVVHDDLRRVAEESAAREALAEALAAGSTPVAHGPQGRGRGGNGTTAGGAPSSGFSEGR